MEAWIQAELRHHEPGWSRAYPLWCAVIREHGLLTGAEIGVAFGGHSEAILSTTGVGRLYSVDMFRHDPAYHDPLNFTQEQFDQLYPFVQSRLSRFGDRCELVRLESGDAARSLPDELDFVYLDANHSFEGVFRDLGLWAEKVRDGGIIGGHDYGHPDFPGIRIAVDNFCRRFGWTIHEEGEGVWWAVKSPVHTSFIVPSFNCSSTLDETLNSILSNNLAEGDEIIVVDDASTDQTPALLDQWKRTHPSLKILKHRVNRGTAAAARNTGIEAAENPLVFCIDSDNVLAPASLGPLGRHLLRTGADAAAYGEMRYFVDRIENVTHSVVYHAEITLADALAGHHWPGPSGNYLFTRESWQRAGRYHEPTLENPTLDSWVFGIRQLATGSRLVTLPGTWYFHRYGHESHYVRNLKRGSQSLAGLIGLLPFLDLLDERDVEYVFGKRGRYKWFENLSDRPLRLEGHVRGEDGSTAYTAAYRRQNRWRWLSARWKKVRARLIPRQT